MGKCDAVAMDEEQMARRVAVIEAAAAQPWWFQLGVLVAAVLAGVVAHLILKWAVGRVAKKGRTPVLATAAVRLRGPVGVFLPLVAVQVAMPAAGLPGAAAESLRHALGLAFIATVAWMVVRTIAVADDMLTRRYATDVADNLQARRVRTQAQVLHRVVVVVVWIIAAASMLMTFPRARQLGTSVLASAGIAGIVVGMAARPALSNLIAGVQIALTQPIRLDDVVVIGGEFGNVEEIGATYVVIRVWDQRRLIVPLSDVIEKPFENWTRRTSTITGTATIPVDFTVPVPAVREELKRILDASPHWDKQAWNLQVTEASSEGVTLRALMTAPSAGVCWELKCEVREGLIAYLQRAHPGALARSRVTVDGAVPRGGPQGQEAEGSGPGGDRLG